MPCSGQTIPVAEDLSSPPNHLRGGPPASPLFIKLVVASVIAGASLVLGVPSVSATVWNLPAQDLSQTGQNATGPQLAVGPDGATTVTWRRFDGTNNIVQAATRPAGSNTFGAPEDLSPAGEDANDPQVAIAPDGATTVTWRSFDGTNSIVQAATRPAGSNTFGDPQDLSQAGQDGANPRVAIAPDGATTIIWRSYDGSVFSIQAATRPAGSNTFGAPQDLSQPGQSPDNPQVAIAPDGATTVCWTGFDGSVFSIQAATRPAGSNTFGDPEGIADLGQNADAPQLAVGPDGATTVTWRHFNGINNIIQTTTRPAGSNTFGDPEDLSQAGQNASSPQVAVAPDGTSTVITWQRFDGSKTRVQAVTRPAGSNTFGDPEDVSQAGQDALDPQLAISRDGDTTVTWRRSNGSDSIIQAVTRPAGSNTFGDPQDLSQAGRDAINAKLAIAPDGATTVTWRRFNGSNYIVQAVTGIPTTYRQLSVTKSGTGEGTVTSTPAGIDCGATCEFDFSDGASVTLNAAAASGSTFTGWSEAGCSGTGSCEVTMSEARSVTAAFTAEPSPPTPSSKITVSSVKSKVTKNSVLITSKVKVSGKGKISQQATTGKRQNTKVWCKTSKTIGAAGIYTLKCNLGNKGRKAIRKQALKLDLRTSFTPAEGSKVTADRKLTVKRKR